MNWVIDRQNRVHVQACRHAGNRATTYVPTSVRINADGKPEQFIPKTYAAMREHLSRPDRGDKNHIGPCAIRPCESCIPVEG